MKKVFVFALFFALALPLYCQTGQESTPFGQETPSCSLNFNLKNEANFYASYTDANFFGKNIRRISLGFTFIADKK